MFIIFECRFTPTNEVDLCGHATLASAHALYESGRVASTATPINFVTKNGEILSAKKRPDGMVELDFPSTPPTPVTLTEIELDGILEGLTIKKEDIIYTGKTIYDFFIEINATKFAGLQTINFESLSRLEARGIIITCRGTSAKNDFSSRWFGPRYVNDKSKSLPEPYYQCSVYFTNNYF
jgi:predicted PhzF superfamily epimerase YddE/YHI9